MNNEIAPAKLRAPRPLSAPQQTTQSPGIFEDFDAFQGAYKIAQALSKTQLIPKQFQGKPEDCLIALDYARRLGVAPTAIMPHLFCVYGTPSMSSQMMIALVNRSGRFSRVHWDEGTDGTVTFKGIKGEKVEIPNLWAVARFKERATGEEHTSPRVDLRMALVNGWLTKGEDKGQISPWQKIPQTMLRYRSASMLINSTCPELKLGMETVEDVADYGGSSTTPTVELAPTPELESTPDETPRAQVSDRVLTAEEEQAAALDLAIDEICEQMEKAQTLEALNMLAEHVAAADFDDGRLQILRNAYAARKLALESEVNAPARNNG